MAYPDASEYFKKLYPFFKIEKEKFLPAFFEEPEWERN